MITDTHCHLYEECYDDIDQVLSRSEKNGVYQFIIPNVDSASIEPIRKLINTHPNCYAAMGLHPTYVNQQYEAELTTIKSEIDKNQCIAIGEVGIDLHWSKEFIEQQKKAFETQIIWSIEKNLPLIIHSREAFQEVFDLLEPYRGKIRGVFHSFTGNEKEANRIINDFNFMIGINGVATYKNSNLKNVLKSIPVSHILLETDSPYLSPVPMRGKRNEPTNLTHIAPFVASILSMNIAELETRIEENVNLLFGIRSPKTTPNL